MKNYNATHKFPGRHVAGAASHTGGGHFISFVQLSEAFHYFIKRPEPRLHQLQLFLSVISLARPTVRRWEHGSSELSAFGHVFWDVVTKH